jgi:hypothetical protein
MNRFKSTCVALGLSGAAFVIAYPVYAHCGKCAADARTVAKALTDGKVSLAKCIEAAESHSKGKAISVINEVDKGSLQTEVFCVASDKLVVCKVDPKTSTVTSMKEAKHFPITEEADHEPHASANTITNQLVETGCAGCIYQMSGATGCELAVKIDGKAYKVTGANIDAHQFCTKAKTALVSGRIEGDRFIATKFEVQAPGAKPS